MKNVVIRTLGGRGIGYGHFFRCLSLAKAIKILYVDTTITFIVNDELIDLVYNNGFEYKVSNDLVRDYELVNSVHPNLFIFDSCLGTNEYLGSIKEKTQFMLIDDNNDIYDSSIPDIIYNGNIHAEKLGYSEVEGQLRLLGPKYLIMKEEYWDNESNEVLEKEGLLVTTGGTDEYGITLKIIEAIRNIDIKTKVIVGPGYNDDYIDLLERMKTDNVELIYRPNSLKKYISNSKLVVTAGGSTVYEVLSQRSIPIIFSLADNQDLACKAFSEIGIYYIGKHSDIDYNKIVNTIEKLNNNNLHIQEDIFGLTNGTGALSVARIIMEKVS